MALNLPPTSPSSPGTLRAHTHEFKLLNITVLGAGAFGQAIAIMLSREGHKVRVLDIVESRITGMNTVREDGKRYNPDFLTTFALPETCVGVFDPAEAFTGVEAIFSAIPIQFCESYLTKIKPHIVEAIAGRTETLPFVSLSKGIALSNLELIHSVYERVFGFNCKEIAQADHEKKNGIPSADANRAAVFGTPSAEPTPAKFQPITPVFVSGPSFAHEIGANLPTGLSVASPCEETAYFVATTMKSKTVVPRVSSDYIGVELLGALKNSYAIGAGIVQGLYPGKFNTFSLYTTLALGEMSRMAADIFGADPRSVTGLSGLGDVILSFSGPSRNRELGTTLAETQSTLAKLIEGSKGVVEGVPTTKALHSILTEREVIRQYPILRTIHSCLFNDQPTAEAFDYIFSLPVQSDF